MQIRKLASLFLFLSIAPLAHSTEWSVLTPLGSEAKSLGDDRLREGKLAIQEALDFDGVFPGADSSNPRYAVTLSSGTSGSRPTGNDRPTGKLYFNTTLGALERWTGASWLPYDVVPTTSITNVDISTDLAGDGLTGGNGSNLALNASTTYFAVITDTLTIVSNSIGSAVLADAVAFPTSVDAAAYTLNTFAAYPILQIVGPATDATANTTTNTSFENTGVTLAITPKATSSKILVFANGQANTATSSCYVTLARAGTNLSGAGGIAAFVSGNSLPFHLTAIDAPSTTSSVTYSIQFKVDAGGTCAMPTNTFANVPTASLYLVEVAQ